MKSIAKIFFIVTVFAATVFAATVALAASSATQRVLLDDHTVVAVPVATSRVTTISFPSPIEAIDGAGFTVDEKRPASFNSPMSKARRSFPCVPSPQRPLET